MDQTLRSLTLAEFKAETENPSIIVLDSRPAPEFTLGFIPGALSIGLEGRFGEWAGDLVPLHDPLVLVTMPGMEMETANQLYRVGFTQLKGFLAGGFDTWKNAGEPIDMIINIEADELAMDIPFDEHLIIIDVRRETEFGDSHVADAINIPLSDLTDPASMGNFEDNHNLYIHCAVGYRSVIAASLFKRQGIHNLRNVVGGFESIKLQPTIEIVKENRVLN
ncbi:MAG TPA: rhodanese-like domain-containing protein [Flavitalea sp.]|nr:rhodanese-like domain-containing protein [Flavitalea sp.]